MAASSGKDAFGSQGTEAAQYIINYIASLATDVSGIALHGRPYPDGKATTGDVIDYLAEPKHGPKRDIRPNEEDGTAAATVLVDEVARRLNIDKGKATTKGKAVTAPKDATLAAIGGLKKAGEVVRRSLINRVNSQTLNDGSKADAVSKPYAAWRKNKYSVAEGSVFKRSGLFLGTLTSGQLKIHRRGGLFG